MARKKKDNQPRSTINISALRKSKWSKNQLKGSPQLGKYWYPGVEEDINSGKIKNERDLKGSWSLWKEGLERTRETVKKARPRPWNSETDEPRRTKKFAKYVSQLPQEEIERIFKEDEAHYPEIEDDLKSGALKDITLAPYAKKLREQYPNMPVTQENIERLAAGLQPQEEKPSKARQVWEGFKGGFKDTPGSFQKMPVNLQVSPLENQLSSILGTLLPQFAQQAQAPTQIPQIPYASQLARGPMAIGALQGVPQQQPSNLSELLAQIGQQASPMFQQYADSSLGKRHIGQAKDIGLGILERLGLYKKPDRGRQLYDVLAGMESPMMFTGQPTNKIQ